MSSESLPQSTRPGMAVFLRLLRGLGRPALGLVVLAGLLHLLVVSNFTGRLVNEEVYYAAIDSAGLYNRIYDEVLVDDALASKTGNLLGGVQLDVHQQIVEVLREVLPPAYLREQTEDNIERFTAYMNGDAEQLEIYLELEEPLGRVLPTIHKHVRQAISTLDISKAAESLCTSEDIRLLAADTAPLLQRLSGGRLPESVPGLRPWNVDCREQAFDQWLDGLVNDPALDRKTSGLLAQGGQELRLPFVEGDTRLLLQTAAELLVEPLAQDAVADLQAELLPGYRLDLIQLVAEQSGGLTKADIGDSAESLRGAASASNGLGRAAAWAAVAVGSILLALTYRPNLVSMLRWPGVVLVAGGAVCLIAGYLLNLTLPGILRETVESGYYGGAPQSAIRLVGDLLEGFGQQATAGFVLPALGVVLVGVILVAASFLINRSRRYRMSPRGLNPVR